MKIGELFVELGFKTDNEKLKKFAQGINNLKKNLILTQFAFVGAVISLDRFVNGTLKGVIALKSLNEQTGLSTREIQRWQQAGRLANLSLSAEEISNSIAKLQNNLAQIRRGRGNIAPFQLLGIDVASKDAFQVLEAIRNSIKDIDNATATNLIKKLGLDPRFISILKLSRQEFDKLAQNFFLSPQQQRNILRLGQNFRMLTLRLKALKDQAVAKITPQLERLIKNFFMWIDKNGNKIINTISSLARVFNNFAMAVGNAFGLIVDMLESVFGLENGIKTLTLAIALLSLSLSPILAGLVLFIGFLDDIRVWIEGGDSLFGKFYDYLDGIIKRTEIIRKTFDFMKENPFFSKVMLSAGTGAVIGGKFGGGVGALGGAGVGSALAVFLEIMKRSKEFVQEQRNTTNNINMNIVSGGDARETAVITVEELVNTQSQLNNGGI
jgi:hypothetical protein